MLSRDKDYRGQRPPADFHRFIYEVRRGKAGALEVLQDVLEETFPRQFREAREEAVTSAKTQKARAGLQVEKEWVVLLDGRVIRQRFRPWKDARSLMSFTPFTVREAQDLVRGGYLPKATAIVWSTRTGLKVSEKLRKHTRRRRAPFLDTRHPAGPRWYGRVR